MYEMFVDKIKGLQYQLKAGHMKSWIKFYHDMKPVKDEVKVAYDLGGLSTEEFHKLNLMLIQTMKMYERCTDMH